MSLTANDKLKLIADMQADGFDLKNGDLQSAVSSVESSIYNGTLISGNVAIDPNSNVGKFASSKIASNPTTTTKTTSTSTPPPVDPIAPPSVGLSEKKIVSPLQYAKSFTETLA